MKKNILNQKFYKLTVIEKLNKDKYQKQLWKCKCDCGNEIIVNTSSLTTGNTKSCGCYKNELIRNLNYKHGNSHTKLYYVWQTMIKRCTKINNKSYKIYGNRGITVCIEWKSDFINFYNWAIANGYKQGLTIDRINNNGNYEPNNCRWTSMKEQARNTSKNKYIVYMNEKMLISDACNKSNVKISSVFSKMKRKNITLQESFDYYLNKQKDIKI